MSGLVSAPPARTALYWHAFATIYLRRGMSLRNRVALITGGSRGIGRGIAVRLAQDGARVAIAYRSNKAAAQQTLLQLQASGVDCVAVETDISDAPRAEQLLRTVVDRFGRIDVLVNNVGDFRWGTLAESSLEDWQSIFSSNLMTVLYMSRAALPHMRRGRWGRIINLGAGRAGWEVGTLFDRGARRWGGMGLGFGCLVAGVRSGPGGRRHRDEARF